MNRSLPRHLHRKPGSLFCLIHRELTVPLTVSIFKAFHDKIYFYLVITLPVLTIPINFLLLGAYLRLKDFEKYELKQMN